MRECRSIQVVRRMHELVAERGGRVADQGHVITQLHGESAGGLNAAVGEHTDGDDMRDAVLLELEIEVSIGEAALRPVLLDDDVASLRHEIWMPFAADNFYTLSILLQLG